MKVLLTGKNSEIIGKILKAKGIELVKAAPDLVVAFGGDGTLLGAEREFPGVPKFPIRDNVRSPLCIQHQSYEKMVDNLIAGRLERHNLIKLAGIFGDRMVVGINDVFIHNSNPVSAMRYRVYIDDEPYEHEIVGDGVGVSTVHGSTAYYRSITHSVFKVGIGLAFSNSTELTNHLVLPEDSIIKIKVVRGPGTLVADNGPDGISLKEDEVATIRKVPEKAIVLGHDIFMCQRCRRLRHPNPYNS